MSAIRILYLDDIVDGFIPRLEREFGEVRVTHLETAEIFNGNRYIVIPRACQLARHATPQKYDLVLIADNQGTGYTYSALVPPAMRDRTVVIWENYREGREAHYVFAGYNHFGDRDDQIGLLAYLVQVAV